MAKPKVRTSDIVGEIVDLLGALTADQRTRVIHASLTLLGDTAAPETDHKKKELYKPGAEDEQVVVPSQKAKSWQKQNGISDEQLSEAFHSENGVTEVIVSEMPGKNKKEQTLNAYVLSGIAGLLASGSPNFTDTAARTLCTSAGCYDGKNHGYSLKGKGNWFTGSKEKGWTLTAPGLKYGATLVKLLAAEPE
jgi:hypothetical protein